MLLTMRATVTLAEKSKIADVMEAKWFEDAEIIIEQVAVLSCAGNTISFKVSM